MDWYYTIGTEKHGPIDEATLRSRLNGGEITPDTPVWNEVNAAWLPLSRALPPELPELETRQSQTTRATRRIARRLFFYVTVATSAYSLIDLPFFKPEDFYSKWVVLTIFFLIGLILLPFAIIENLQRRSPRLFVYLPLPIVLKIVSVVLVTVVSTDESDFGSRHMWAFAFSDFAHLLCLVIAVDGLARLREEGPKLT